MFEEVAADFVANGGVLASEDAGRSAVVSRFGGAAAAD